MRKSTSASGRPGGIIYYSGRLDAARECSYSPELSISAQAKPLPKAAGCDWDQLLDAHGRDFEALFGQVNDATLQEATSAGNTIVHYLAQIGDVERLAVVLRRTVGRQIVHKRNARGHTALEYAAARGHDGVAQTLSCYNQEHLADEHVADKMLSHHATRSYRVARQASCAARGSMPK